MAATTFNSSESGLDLTQKNTLKSGWQKFEVYRIHNPSRVAIILTGNGTKLA